MSKTETNNPVYTIPIEAKSPIIYTYFLNQNLYDLSRLREQYEYNVSTDPENKDYIEVLEMIKMAIEAKEKL